MKKIIRNMVIGCSVAVLSTGMTLTSAAADAISDFYEGKVVTIYVGYTAGGGYDAYGRLLARHIGKQIPGNPTVIVKNKAGGGSLTLTNWLYNKAPKDGTAIGAIARAMPVHNLFGRPGGRFDSDKFNWLGSMNSETAACVVTSKSPVQSFSELRQKSAIMGGTGPSSDSETFANFVTNLLGAKIKLISGYPGTAQAALSMDRGEVDGICGWSYNSLLQMRGAEVASGELNIIMQIGLNPHPDLAGIPLITEFAQTDEERAQMDLIFSRQTMGRPFVMAPGVPQDRVDAMRSAFEATLRDPDFLAEAKKSKIDIALVTGDKVQELIAKVFATSPETIAAAMENIKPGTDVTQAKVTFLEVTGAITKLENDARKLFFMENGKEVVTGVSGSRTATTIDGKKVKRGAFKVGMVCDITWLGAGSEAKIIACNS